MEFIGWPILAVLFAVAVIALRGRWEMRHGISSDSRRSAAGGWVGDGD
jgi:hypothetical protein